MESDGPQDGGQPMCEASGPFRRGREIITFTRRRELMTMAAEIADWVNARAKPHERCLLRNMVENLLESN